MMTSVNDPILFFKNSLESELLIQVEESQVNEKVVFFTLLGVGLRVFYYPRGGARWEAISFGKDRILHIDQDQWMRSPKIILNRIAVLCGKGIPIHARQTVVARIDKKVSREFQKEFHLNGVLDGKYRYGLFREGELVSVAVFSGLRNMKQEPSYRSIELLHFCQKGRYLVRGGLSKLLKQMHKDFEPNDVMTYVEKDWSTGENYRTLGFERRGERPPVQFCIDPIRYERIRLSRLDTPDCQSGYSVWNSGSLKLIKYFV